ncbi:MAG: aminoacyl-tRNA hydrolase [Hyphomicrobiales bacterium]|nr:aminoacyl-tRNA hydrolase [Hyphomicrobiales bacterium]MBV9111574.1 aminoacyl-tRNA hydrolase [Hyphomicrobiales bacterium]MBV9520588.1 aminoacyl-tRNA hydrolase [Hyphomicrobiales bacterium]
MQILVGLGNPGSRYAGNRHNIGFMVLDAIAREHRAAPWRRRFQSEAAEAVIGGERALLLKPQTYMNDSGRAVGEAARFFKTGLEAITVFHDELDLKEGKLRVKMGGGNAGHNGLRSISAHLGNEYRRVRLGIGHPGDKNLVYPYVLSDFFKEEWPWVKDLVAACAEFAALLVKGEDSSFQNKVHLAMQAKGWGETAPQAG